VLNILYQWYVYKLVTQNHYTCCSDIILTLYKIKQYITNAINQITIVKFWSFYGRVFIDKLIKLIDKLVYRVPP